jgi:hypothetical protein
MPVGCVILKATIVPYIILALSAISAVIIINSNGIGITPDSISYVESAANIASGKDYAAYPLISELNLSPGHFPPGLPLLLALGLKDGLEVEAVGVIINALSLAVLAMMIYAINLQLGSHRIVRIISCLLLFHPSLLSQYTRLSSEPLFIALITVGIFSLWLYLEKPNRMLLLLSAVLLGLSVIVRYAGIPFVAVAVAILFISRRKIGETLLFGDITLIPIMLWVIYLANNSTEPDTIRMFAPHIIPLSKLLDGARAIGGWFVPVVVPLRTGWAGLIVLLVLVAYYDFFRKNIHTTVAKFLLFIGAFQGFYGLFLLISISFFDAHTPLDSRILAPIYPLSMLSICVALGNLPVAKKRLIIIGSYLLLIILYSWSWMSAERLDGNDFSSKYWTESPLIEFVNSLPPDTIIYSNGADVIYWYTHRIIHSVPRTIDTGTPAINTNYADEVETMRIALNNGAYLIFFSLITWRDYLPSLDDLQPLPPSQVLSD